MEERVIAIYRRYSERAQWLPPSEGGPSREWEIKVVITMLSHTLLWSELSGKSTTRSMIKVDKFVDQNDEENKTKYQHHRPFMVIKMHYKISDNLIRSCGPK